MKFARSSRRFAALACFLILAAALCAVACDRESDVSARDLQLAREAYAGGYFMDAEGAYERYLQGAPEGRHRLEAWNRLAEICSGVTGNLNKAVAVLETATAEFGDRPKSNWPLLFRLGEVYEQLGQRKKAVAAWARCVDAAGNDVERACAAQMRMALADRAMGRHELAADLLGQCGAKAGDPAVKSRALYELAQTYSITQNWEKTKSVLADVLKMPRAPQDTKIMCTFLLADTYEAEHDIPKARELFTSLEKTYPNPAVIKERLGALGQRDQGVAAAALRPPAPAPGDIPSAKVRFRRVHANSTDQ